MSGPTEPRPGRPADERFGAEDWRPARETKTQRAWRPGQRKRARSVRAMFASTVLCLEAVLLFFLGMTLFGLNRGADHAPWVAVAFTALAAVAVLDCALVRRPLGVAIGWAIQAVLIASGFWEYSMFVIGPLFALTWWYAITKGDQIDRENAARARAQAAWEASHPEEAGPRT
ncbi:DUF4233 domain-containing protein [Micrococcus sp. ACRRV]|uniref:DUF4233 domain-containing protein n=1 Tax=Micrococcus sp. ACRRV TaxID=2918203 RepID=UPI001EF2BEB6|nr:DUF4233 domain-containing protein [Micrococcus sp. ACRRV]MCG7422164.1 DUF4233 domain-containing protein [Micrococcus sp. ACRRV]